MSFSTLRATFLSLVLLGRTALAEQPPTAARVLRVELTAEPRGGPWRIPVAPGQVTVLVFGSELQRDGVILEGREYLALVEVGERSITVIPASTLTADALVRLTVRFLDGAAPESATFLLVASAEGAVHQVEVQRAPRSAASYQREAEQEREKARRCQEDYARLRAARGGLEPLTALYARGELGEGGVTALNLWGVYAQASGAVLTVTTVRSYRSAERVGVAMRLELTGGGTSWAARSVPLKGEGGEVLEASVWQRAPIAPGGMGWVFIEIRAGQQQARGTYTLSLREAGGARSIRLEGIRFP